MGSCVSLIVSAPNMSTEINHFVVCAFVYFFLKNKFLQEKYKELYIVFIVCLQLAICTYGFCIYMIFVYFIRHFIMYTYLLYTYNYLHIYTYIWVLRQGFSV